jgi:hypothetical protein
MSEATVEVVHVDGAWRVRVDGQYTLSARYRTHAQALAAGADLADERGVRLKVRDPSAR